MRLSCFHFAIELQLQLQLELQAKKLREAFGNIENNFFLQTELFVSVR